MPGNEVHASRGGIKATRWGKGNARATDASLWTLPLDREGSNVPKKKRSAVTDPEGVRLPKKAKSKRTLGCSSFYYFVSYGTVLQLANQIVRIALFFVKREQMAMVMCKCIDGHDPNGND